jgi:diguanylate cyclase (GGDEF)-like protein
MSLFRRIWLTIIGLTLAAFIGSLLVNTFTARSYLEKQLDIKNRDNATALALAMSQQADKDPVTMELLLSALFDNGHYQEIRLTDPHGKVIVERRAPVDLDQGAPTWFVAMLPIRVSPGVAHITDGWKQYGSITLASHSKFAYRDLWQGTLELVGWFVLSGVLAGLLGTWLLRLITRPLNQVVDQARAISDRRFVSIARTHVPELDSVVGAMNDMVSRLKQHFADEATRLDVLRKKLSHDGVTGLPNRDYFIGRLHEALENEDSAATGVLLMLRIRDLGEINRQLGHAETDALLRGIAALLRETCGERDKWLPARLNGQDFALLAQHQEDVEALAQSLARRLLQLRDERVPTIEALFHIGAIQYQRGEAPSEVLACADQQLARAEGQEANVCSVQACQLQGDSALPAESWRESIHKALEAGRVTLKSYPVISARSGQLIHREAVVRLQTEPDAPWCPAGDFIPYAMRFKLMPAIDLAVARLAMEELRLTPGTLAINLSADTFAEPESRRRFIDLLQGHKALSVRLWVEMPAFGVASHFDVFREFCWSLHALGCKVGIENFGRKLNELNRLAGIGVDYVKLDSSFVRGIDANDSNRELLAGLCRMAQGIGMQVIAVGVQHPREREALVALGIDGITGPVVEAGDQAG